MGVLFKQYYFNLKSDLKSDWYINKTEPLFMISMSFIQSGNETFIAKDANVHYCH
jgi:hypothetical protein